MARYTAAGVAKQRWQIDMTSHAWIFGLDTDTAADDAVALMTALRAPGVDVEEVAIALDPTTCTDRKHCYVKVETHSAVTRGMPPVDRSNVPKHPANLHVCYAINARRWKTALRQLLRA